MAAIPHRHDVEIAINGTAYRRTIDVRTTLADFIRHEARLTGTHVGCEHGVCGVCTVQLDGEPVRSCTLLAIQAEDHAVRTVEALAARDQPLHPLQLAFHEAHGLQCGFCTPGLLMTLEPLLAIGRRLSEDEIRHAIAGNLCRCTGYQHIVEAVQLALSRTPGAANEPEEEWTR